MGEYSDQALAEKLGWRVEQMPWGAPNAGDWVLVDPDGVHDEPMATEAAAWAGVPNWASPLGFVWLLGRLVEMGWSVQMWSNAPNGWSAQLDRGRVFYPADADTPQRALALAAWQAVGGEEG